LKSPEKGDPLPALIFDFGGPVLLTPFELRHQGEDLLGLKRGSLSWSGPFDPEADPDWRDFQNEIINEREYWKLQVEHFSELMGKDTTMKELMAALYAGPESELVRPMARELLRDAQSHGIPVGMLTNDLTSFHGTEWIAGITIISEFDAMVDGRQDGVLKPDPAAYRLMCERMGVPVKNTVFIDDQPVNLRGAEELGMLAIHLDPRAPEEGFMRARGALGLTN
jgi:putative hydrolase of the HAD superfamily